MPASALLTAASIASLNLCTDEYLLLLAKPQEIASVSFLSQDPLESPLWKRARGHQTNRGSLEDILGTKPKLVLTMGGGGRATSLIARRIGIKAVDLRPVTSLSDVAANFQSVATALGEPERAAPWLVRLGRLRASAPARARDAIWIGGGGQTVGVPSIGADWMRLAGLKQRALTGDRVSLETLIIRPPGVLVQSRYRSEQVSRGIEWMKHPVVRNMKTRRVETDGRAWTCMGPLVISEVERLRLSLQ
ncbi:MAG: ABC transporter substrate-binding protein [Sphingomonas sp.]|nr:ABC transporter substrate-binding protein [Sphingomonas sp.]